MRRTMTPLALALCVSCGAGDPGAQEVSFAAVADFQLTVAEEDPRPEHRPEQVDCSALTGWYLEDDVVEVNSARCNYFSAHAPALAAARPGDELRAEVSHFDLTAPQPATAHLALLVGEHAVWEHEVTIPGPADVVAVRAELAVAVAEGTAVTWHLHNHGQNTWRLSEVLLRAR